MPIVIKKGRRYSTGICTSTLICQACYSKINSNVLHGEFLSNIHSFSMNFYVTGLFNKILKLDVNFCIWEIRDKERCQKLHNWSNCAQIKINDPLFVPNDENFVFLVKKEGFLIFEIPINKRRWFLSLSLLFDFDNLFEMFAVYPYMYFSEIFITIMFCVVTFLTVIKKLCQIFLMKWW